MKKSLMLASFIFFYSISSGQSLRLLWTGGGAPGNWNDSTNWLQTNAPVGQTPLRRVPTEIDDVVFSRSQSGLTGVNLQFAGFDSLVVGKIITTGSRCRSMRVSNTNLQLKNDSHSLGYAMTISVYTINGGKLLIDSSSSVPYGYISLHGGNTAIKDLEIINSSFGVVNAHNTAHCNIFIHPNGKARFINSQLISPFLGSSSLGGELFADNCDISTATFRMGTNSHVTLLNTEVHGSMLYPDLAFHIGRNSIFNSSNANVTSWMFLNFYTSGAVLNGNVTSQSESSGSIFSQQDSANPLPNIINGNLIFQGGVGRFGIHGDVKISGDFLNYAIPDLIHPDTSFVFVNGQRIFKIGGIANYRNNVFVDNCAQYFCRFKFELYGSGNSRIQWPVGIPLDTMIINKTGCGKVFVDNSLYVSGQLHLQSGQLVLNPNEGIPYKMVSAGNVVVNNGAGIFLRRNASGVAANMAIGGTLVNNNTTSDSTCFGISNPYNGTILTYNPNVNNVTVPVCVSSGTTITSNISGATYRWERNTGSSYVPILDNANFLGATTQTLQLINIPATWNEDSLRCIINGNMTSHTFVLSMVTSLPASVTITSDPIAVCQGANVTFYAHVVNGGPTPTYQWQVNGVNVGTNHPFFWSPNLVLNDQIKVIVQSSLVCAMPQISTSNILTVNTPAAVPSVSITSTAATVCAGSPVTFTAVLVNGGTAPILSWHVNGAFAANGPTFTIPSVIGSTVVRAYMTSSLPCAFPELAISNQITVTVSTTVIPSVNISASATTICPNGSVTFTALPLNGGAQPNYQWQVNGVNVGTNTSTFTTSTLSNGSVVKVILTSSSPCASPATATSNSITVTVSSTIVPTVSITASTTTICNNGDVVFTATPVDGGTQPTFQWQVNGVSAGSNSPAFTSSNLLNGSVVIVIMTSSSSCAVPTPATSNSITVTVSNAIIPTVSITASAQNICNNASVTFAATAVNGGPGPIYQWKKNGISVGTNNSVFTTSDLVNADVVSVTMISNATCASPTAVSSNAINISVMNSVTPGITISGTLLVDQGGATTISSSIANGGNSPTYQWQDSTTSHSWQIIGNAVSAALNYSPESTGDKIRAVLTSSASCASSAVATSNVLSFTVARPLFSGRVTTYPNPATSFITVDSLSIVDGWNTLTVMSLSGKVYFSRNITGLNKINIPVQGLLPGMYMIRLFRNVGYPEYKKFIKL